LQGVLVNAFCTNCRKEMPATAVVCPHCGYDFPPPPLGPGGPLDLAARFVRNIGLLTLAAAVLLALASPWAGWSAGLFVVIAAGLGLAGGAALGLAALLAWGRAPSQ